MEISDKELFERLEETIENGHKLIERLKEISQVNGVNKLVTKINQELKFLIKVRSTGSVKKEHLYSTNLIHLNALVQRLLISQEPTGVLKPFKIDNSKLEVDVVCNSGACWIKVIARNAKALTMISRGNGDFGQKSVVDQANAYLSCATSNPHRYMAPKVIFHFAGGIESNLASTLENLGVLVEGRRIENLDDMKNTFDACTNVSEVIFPSISTRPPEMNVESLNSTEIEVLNLDVSTLLAYVSNMTNGSADYVFLEPLLTLQAKWERGKPIKKFLDKVFEGKKLITCETAYRNFMDIIKVIGGPMETERAHEFIKKISIVPDATDSQWLNLKLGGKIKNRSRLIFACAESTKSITVTSNEGFVRAASMQGIECTVVLHEPRSLSEIKEKHATRIKLS